MVKCARQSNVPITQMLIWTGNVGSSAMMMQLKHVYPNVPLGIYHLGLTLK